MEILRSLQASFFQFVHWIWEIHCFIDEDLGNGLAAHCFRKQCQLGRWDSESWENEGSSNLPCSNQLP